MYIELGSHHALISPLIYIKLDSLCVVSDVYLIRE
jgi:hypothetical protein